jgi:hypothetical protein
MCRTIVAARDLPQPRHGPAICRIIVKAEFAARSL